MAVRRLAEKQPESFAFTPDNAAWADRQIAKYPEGRQASAVLSLLWRAQKQNDYWLPQKAIEAVAEKLDMPYIRVLEIATFYTMFNLAPVGRFHIQFCGTTPCVLQGADGIKAVLQRRCGEQMKVSPDGNFSWLEVECLGACCNAPMVQVNDDYYEDLTPENFDNLLDDLAAGRPVTVGSQIGRRSSEPVGGLTSLTTFYGKDGESGPDSFALASANENQPPAPRDVGRTEMPPEAESKTSSDKTSPKTPAPTEPAHERNTQEAEEAAGYPDKTEDTGTRRTEVPRTEKTTGKASKDDGDA